jgi:hypothetical protein
LIISTPIIPHPPSNFAHGHNSAQNAQNPTANPYELQQGFGYFTEYKCKLFVNTFWAYQNNEKRGCIPSLNCAEQLVQPGHLTVLPEEKVLFWNEHNSLM